MAYLRTHYKVSQELRLSLDPEIKPFVRPGRVEILKEVDWSDKMKSRQRSRSWKDHSKRDCQFKRYKEIK